MADTTFVRADVWKPFQTDNTSWTFPYVDQALDPPTLFQNSAHLAFLTLALLLNTLFLTWFAFTKTGRALFASEVHYVLVVNLTVSDMVGAVIFLALRMRLAVTGRVAISPLACQLAGAGL
ncbi:hypothetical protein HK102_007392, partial [Quaeritorhiza haematococci]